MASSLLQGRTRGPQGPARQSGGVGPHNADLMAEQGSSLGTQKGPPPGQGGWPHGVRE